MVPMGTFCFVTLTLRTPPMEIGELLGYYCGGPQLPTKDTTIKGGIREKGELYPVNAFQTF